MKRQIRLSPNTTRLALAAIILGAAPTLVGAPQDSVTSPESFALSAGAFEPHLHGVAQPGRKVALSASQEGILMSLFVEEGQRVKAGQKLAILDNRVEIAAVQSARIEAERHADIDRAQANFDIAKSRFDRTSSSNASGGSTEFEIEESRASFLRAKAEFEFAHEARERAVNQLVIEEARLAEHTIVAPFDGMIAKVNAEQGQSITRDDHVLTLMSVSTLKAEIHLPVSNYAKVFPDHTYTLLASEPVSRDLEATLEFVEPMIDPATRTFRCVFIIDNKDEALPAGFLVRVDAESIQTVLAGQHVEPSG